MVKKIKVLHIAQVTGEEIIQKGMKKVRLLGTKVNIPNFDTTTIHAISAVEFALDE